MIKLKIEWQILMNKQTQYSFFSIKGAYPPKNRFFVVAFSEREITQKYFLKILLRNYKNWLSYSLSCRTGPDEKKKKQIEKKLKSYQNYSLQVNLSIGVFSDALRSENFVKTSNAFISKLHFENGNQDFSDTTWPIWFKFTGLM